VRRLPAARRPARPGLASQVASVVIRRLAAFGIAGVASTAGAGAQRGPKGLRKRGALAHPAARGRPAKAGGRGSLAAAVASAVVGRLGSAGKTRRPAAKPRSRRPSLAIAVASAVSRRLGGRSASRAPRR
jgi:hypothetical protein